MSRPLIYYSKSCYSVNAKDWFLICFINMSTKLLQQRHTDKPKRTPSKRRTLKTPLNIREKVKELEVRQATYLYREVDRQNQANFQPPKHTQKVYPRPTPQKKGGLSQPKIRGKKDPLSPQLPKYGSQTKLLYFQEGSPQQHQQDGLKGRGAHYAKHEAKSPKFSPPKRPNPRKKEFQKGKEKAFCMVQEMEQLHYKLTSMRAYNKRGQKILDNHIEVLERQIANKKVTIKHLYNYDSRPTADEWVGEGVILESDREDDSSSLGLISKIVEDIESYLSLESR